MRGSFANDSNDRCLPIAYLDPSYVRQVEHVTLTEFSYVSVRSFIKRINPGLLPSPQFDYPALNHDCGRTQALLSTCFSLAWFRTV